MAEVLGEIGDAIDAYGEAEIAYDHAEPPNHVAAWDELAKARNHLEGLIAQLIAQRDNAREEADKWKRTAESIAERALRSGHLK
jgi:hypothetical protein